MRVVVTGASGDFGACIVPEVLGRGHEVVGLSRRPHQIPSAAYRHVPADIRDVDAIEAAVQGADAVIHLAWTTHPMHDAEATRAIDVGGTAAVLEAMGRVGVDRLITASSVMVYGANPDNPPLLSEADPLRPSAKHLYSKHKVEAEELIAASSANALVVRATSVMGRGSTGVTREGFATPLIFGMKGCRNLFQFIHPEDLGRFFADALENPQWSGPVNLAGPGTITMRDIAATLGKRYAEFQPGHVAAVLEFLWNRQWYPLDPGAVEAFAALPILDTARLTDEFGFHPAWGSRECVEDFARANRAHVVVGTRQFDIPWRMPWFEVPAAPEETADRIMASDAETAGEFDTSVDPAWSLYTAANTSEAFPGPMAPLSLELALAALRAGGAQATNLLSLDGDLARALTHEGAGSFGHGVYANLSVVYAMGSAMPGGDTSTWDDMLFGERADVERPEIEAIGALGMVRRLPRLAAKLAGYAGEVRLLAESARAAQKRGQDFRGLTDAQLIAQLNRTYDEVANAWAVAAVATALVTPVMGLMQRQGGDGFATRVRGGVDGLASAGIANGAYRLAEIAKYDPVVRETLRDLPATEALVQLREKRPSFVDKLTAVLNDYGHRGPRETELSNEVFADDPARLLDVVAKLTDAEQRAIADEPKLTRYQSILASVGTKFQRKREEARDAAIRRTHQYRLIAREIGKRLARSGAIESPDDVFYLVRDELKNIPADAAQRVSRRRAERKRLETQRPPLNFAGSYTVSTEAVKELRPGDSLTGTAVSAGVAKGRVRVLTVDTTDDLEPGEVLVTEFTDTGWTPYFAYAAAVVVDTGGEMSHAAVVAREFGIPCVVATMNGSTALRTGHLVEVDGASGRITRVE